MQMEALVGGATGGYDKSVSAPVREESSSTISVSKEPVRKDVADMEITPLVSPLQDMTGEGEESVLKPQIPEKEPSKSSIDAAMSLLNSQIERTHCAYSYDEETKRISIKVYDDETEELIREVPPEKSLEALKKIWEIAGIIIDEKR